MNAFEALRVEEAAGIADDQAAVDVVARHGIPAACGKRFCAVADELAAVENFFDVRDASSTSERLRADRIADSAYSRPMTRPIETRLLERP